MLLLDIKEDLLIITSKVPGTDFILTGPQSLAERTTLQSEDAISFSEVDIITPSQKMLARKLTCDIVPGKSMLLTGPNGSGKSSIFRVLRGLWPIISGRLAKPCPSIDEKVGSCADDATNVLNTHLKSILESVRLTYLLERDASGWDASSNWEDVLSLGEQQRLGMIILILFFMDDSATSVDVEEHLYKLATDMGITVITSSQRPALIPFHSTELRLIDGEGYPKKSANLFICSLLSICMSSYVKNNTFFGFFKLSFQKPRKWSQKGPKPEAPAQNMSKQSSRDMGSRSFGLALLQSDGLGVVHSFGLLNR
ncbi:ABC transporter-like, ATP-binding domain [Dillenia turbinata]|uniref:ABC transporter-like, ATP-binding domain n=1 Tax=Dillenia turbinata TaxID=194707 RepID=A0AAN8V609_9MAGN